MNQSSPLTRRGFLQAGLVSSAAAVAGLPLTAAAALTKSAKDSFHGLKMGMASYSLRKFTLDQALAMTQELGVKYLSLKDVHLSYKSTRAERQEARQKAEAAGLTLISAGVIYMTNNEAEVRSRFEYAKDAGLPTIVAAPDIAALDLVEQTAKEFNIHVAIHNHGPGDNRYPSPLDVWRLVKVRDPLMGLCIDVGHTVRLGQDPAPIIQQCSSRLYDFHIKDESAATRTGKATPVGRGVIDLVGVFKALLAVNYAYHVGLEYEAQADAPMPGLIESYAYMRGVLAALA